MKGLVIYVLSLVFIIGFGVQVGERGEIFIGKDHRDRTPTTPLLLHLIALNSTGGQQSSSSQQAAATRNEPLSTTNLDAWKSRNSEWYGVNQEMTAYSLEVDRAIRDGGAISIGSVEYFKEVDRQMRRRYPNYSWSASSAQTLDSMPENDFRILCSQALFRAHEVFGVGHYFDAAMEIFPEQDDIFQEIAAVAVVDKMGRRELRAFARDCIEEKSGRGL